MTVKENPPVVSSKLSTALKPIRVLETLKPLRFSGQLAFTGSKEQQWVFYLYLGQIIYATGMTHPVRRWQRNLAIHCPQIDVHGSTWQRDLASIDAATLTTCWEYQLLCLWVAQQKITREQAAKTIRSVMAEVLFDVAQAMPLTYQTKSDKPFSMELVLIDVEQAIAEIQSLWQAWQNPLLVNYSPNKAPIIKQPEQLRKRRSADVYQTLTKLLDGQHTLRDVAVETKRDVVAVTRSLLPCIQLGWVELTTIPDLPIPLPTPVQRGVPETPPPARTAPTGPLVACVDDSPLVCRTMEGLLTAAGYRFVAVNDALRAIATLLARKPDVIFLDLVMPNANGYEICEQLRKISCFRNTPIVILTGNDGFVDRFRAKVVGASDFLSKPVDAEMVLSVVRKHLEQGAISH